MLRPSCYNIIIRADNNNFIINGHTKAMDVIDSETAAILENINKKSNLIDEYFSHEEKSYLHDRGYLFSGSVEEEQKQFKHFVKELHKEKLLGLKPTITIIPTYSCNLACTYCFEGDTTLKTKILDKHLVDKIFDSYTTYFNKKVELSEKELILFGGEPLLPSTLPIVEYIVEKAGEIGLKIVAITNGTHLDKFIHLIGPEKISKLQLTIDGPKRIHDTRRIMRNGEGTFDQIVNNIDLVSTKDIEIVLRLHLDKNNYKALDEFYEFYNTKWGKSKNIVLFGASLRDFGEIKKENIMRTDQIDLYVEEKKMSVCTSKNSLESNIIPILNENSQSNFMTGYCSANYNSLIYDPFGDIYNCLEVVGIKKYIIGKYDTGNIELNKEKTRIWQKSVVENSPCGETNCKYALFCGGGCKSQALLNGESYFNYYCESFKVLFSRLISEQFGTVLEMEKDGVDPKNYMLYYDEYLNNYRERKRNIER